VPEPKTHTIGTFTKVGVRSERPSSGSAFKKSQEIADAASLS